MIKKSKITKSQIATLQKNNYSLDDKRLSLGPGGVIYVDNKLFFRIGRRGTVSVQAKNGNWVRC